MTGDTDIMFLSDIFKTENLAGEEQEPLGLGDTIVYPMRELRAFPTDGNPFRF